MKYCLTKHALIEDNGDLVATFNPCISADRAFKILDDLNNTKYVTQLEIDLEVERSDYKILEEDVRDLKEEINDLKEEKEKLDDRFQGIIDMLENSSNDYSKEELIKEVIDICTAPL